MSICVLRVLLYAVNNYVELSIELLTRSSGGRDFFGKGFCTWIRSLFDDVRVA